MQNREELRQKGHNRSRKRHVTRGGRNIIFRPKYRALKLPKDSVKDLSLKQVCGAETIFFRSGSDFQKVSAPEPAPAPT